MLFSLAAFTGSLITTLLSLAVYLIGSYAFYKLAKIRMLPNAWLAFIPVFSLYITGMIGDSLKYNHYKINHYISEIPLAYALPILSLASTVIGNVPVLGSPLVAVIELVLWAAQIMVYYFVFSLYAEPKHCIPFTVLSIIPVVGPCLLLYVLKDRRY